MKWVSPILSMVQYILCMNSKIQLYVGFCCTFVLTRVAASDRWR